MCDARIMDRTVRAVLEGDDAAPGRIAATDVARLVLNLQVALMRAAHAVLRRPKRTVTGRYQGFIEQATKLSFVRVEEGSFAGVMSLPDVTAEGLLDMGLEGRDLGHRAWEHLLHALEAPDGNDVDPALAEAVVKLADGVGLGARTRRIRLESVNADSRIVHSAVIDESTRQRMRVATALPAPQQDVVHGQLVEADFEHRTARLSRPAGETVKVQFTDEHADDIYAVLREQGTFVGHVSYNKKTGQVSRVQVQQVIPASEQLRLFGDFHQHRTVAELAIEQGIDRPQQLGSLRSESLDDDELAEFAECAE